MKILVFTGAGGSFELGIPTMRYMVEMFRDHLEEKDLSPEFLEELEEKLENDDYDMEHLVDDLDLLSEAGDVQKEWGEDSEHGLEEDISVVRPEAEWFIQHVCERVEIQEATTLWKSVLRHRSDHDFVIATTNYDRAIELAATQQSIEIQDGFPSFGEKEGVTWKGFDDGEGLKLLKLHGSTNWYFSEENDAVWKVRHPMPLFGEITLQMQEQDEVALQNAAVLPSREKKIRRPPYPTLNSEFQQQPVTTDIAIFIGSSLRDPNIRSAYNACVDKCDIFLVNPSGEYISQVDTEETSIIQQSASAFLISTLPTALNQEDEEIVDYLLSETENHLTDGILQEVMIATDPNQSLQQRLDAIDKLASLQISLEKEEILPLLQSEETAIQKYALSLIQESPGYSELYQQAEEIATQNPNSDFADEFDLLEELTDD